MPYIYLYYIYERSEYININIYSIYNIIIILYIYIILLLYILYYILYLYILTTFVYNNIIYNIRQNGQIGKMYTQGGHTFRRSPLLKK